MSLIIKCYNRNIVIKKVMIKKNIQIAKQLLGPIEKLCKICGVMGSSVYKQKGDVDIDMFVVLNNKNFNSLHSYISPLATSKSNEDIVHAFEEKRVNFNSYYVLFEEKEVDLIVMSDDLFKNITNRLLDHYAITLKQKVAKVSKKKYYLFGIDGSKTENIYSYQEKNSELIKFPINLTIDQIYYAFLPLSNILGSTNIFTGKKLFKKSKNNLIALLNKKFEESPKFNWKNLTV